jgi:hypothetical protein
VRVCGFAGVRVCGFAGVRVCGFAGVRVCGPQVIQSITGEYIIYMEKILDFHWEKCWFFPEVAGGRSVKGGGGTGRLWGYMLQRSILATSLALPNQTMRSGKMERLKMERSSRRLRFSSRRLRFSSRRRFGGTLLFSCIPLLLVCGLCCGIPLF